jgi:AraC-like DNA-binding protein
VWVFARVTRESEPPLRILAREGISLAEYFNPDTRIRHAAVMEMLRIAVETGDPAVGLRAGESVQLGDFATLEYAARSCATLGEAIRCYARYIGLIHEAAEISLTEEGNDVVWRHRVTDGVPQPPAANDFVMAASVAFAKMHGEVYEPAIEVHLAHARPTDPAAYERIFRTRVRFGMPHNAFILTRKHLEAPMRRAHARLHTEYERHAGELMARVRVESDVTGDVRRVLLADLRTGVCSMASTARKLSMSVATLRRRLEEEGETYATIVDAIRYDLARRYLVDRRLATSEVAFLLGFSNASSFSKAFRRWADGVTPTEYRMRGGSQHRIQS